MTRVNHSETTAEVAIIGAGFSGVMTAIQLARQWRDGTLRVVLCDRTGRFASGAAYGTRCMKHLLNVPAGDMSALPDEPDHFVRWGQGHGLVLGPKSFVPRKWYGEYLSWLLDDCLHRTPVQLKRVNGAVVDVISRRGSAELRVDDGRVLRAERVVLALGNSPPANPTTFPESLCGASAYVSDPWRPDALTSLPVNQDVLLVGTGLTAVDVILELHALGFAGHIHAVSRRGLLPQPHRPSPSPGAVPAPAEVLRAKRTAAGLCRGFRAAVRRAEILGGDWRDVVASLRPFVPAIWRELPLSERERFLRHLRPFWDTHRHRLPPQVDAALRMLRESGRITVHSACVVKCSARADDFTVGLRPRGGSGVLQLRVGAVVNCTGPNSDVQRSSDPLLQNLLRSGLAQPDPLGLGLLTTEQGGVIDANGRSSTLLYAIGSLRRATLWESTAVPELRVQASELAGQLWKEISRSAERNNARRTVPADYSI